jgi:tetratricopeptide (TPR) repeat protein
MNYAIELDPLSRAIAVACARIRFMFGDHEGALASCERALELAPRFFSAHAWLSVICSDMGQHERALSAWDRLRELHPDTRVGAASQAWVLAGAGRQEEARAIADAAGEMSGLIYARLGETDEAFRRLEKALSDPSWRLFSLERTLLFNIKVGPWFDPLRDDPRFEHLLQLMNMAD